MLTLFSVVLYSFSYFKIKMFSLLLRFPSFISNRFGNPFVSSSTFSHITSDGNITMVDISQKANTQRRAIAEAIVKFPDAHTYQSYFNVTTKKGDARLCSKLAGILAAKVSFSYEMINLWRNCYLSSVHQN